MKILFFGTPRFAQIVLKKLINSPYKPIQVITAPDGKTGRGLQLTPTPVKKLAQQHDIEVLTPQSLNEVNNLDFDLAILVAYGKIIPKNILSIPKHGFINVHPSLLPKYRGPSPIQSTILAGEVKTGVSIMVLDKEIDHGPVIAAKKITISPQDTHESLVESLGKTGANLLLDILPGYLKGKLKPKPQNHVDATSTSHITKQNGFIDLENPPDSKTLDRMIRAYYPWPTVWTKLDGKIIKFLPQGKIQPEGKRVMSLIEFKNGYPKHKESLARLFDF
jgi:methionyl-tRNA formyltransferase